MDGQNPVTVNVQITTTARSGVSIGWAEPGLPQWPQLAFPLVGFALISLVARLAARVKEVRDGYSYAGVVVLFLVAIIGAGACGGGSGSTGATTGTPAGTYTITVTASSTGTESVQQSLKLALKVN